MFDRNQNISLAGMRGKPLLTSHVTWSV